MKKLLALALAVVIVASVGGSLASAAPGDLAPGPAFSDIAGLPSEGALTALGALGIFSGSYGLGNAVKPNDPITREQFCKVVVVAKGLSASATALQNVTPQFKDGASVSRWAWGYVNAAVQAKIIGGYTDGTFQGSNNVKYSEAIKMLVCAIKGHMEQTDTVLGWPNQWVFYAASNNFLGGVVIPDPNTACTRGDMARMLLAAMQVAPLKADGTPEPDKALLPAIGLNTRVWTGKFQGRTAGDMFLDTVPGPIVLGERVYLVGAASYDACVGNDVLCIADTTQKVVVVIKQSGAGTVSGIVDQLSSDASGTFIKLRSGQKVYYTGSIPVAFNNEEGNTQTCLGGGDEVVINLGADGKAVAAVATRWDLINTRFPLFHPPLPITWLLFTHPEDCLAGVTVSSGATNTRITFPAASPFWYGPAQGTSLAGATLEVGPSCVVTINGAAATRDDLKKDDIIKGATYGGHGYVDATSIIRIAATRKVVDGTVTSKRTVTDATGTKCYVTVNAGGTTREYLMDPDAHYVTDPFEGSRYKFALNEEGTVFFNVGIPPEIVVAYVISAETLSGSPATYKITYDCRGTTYTKACIGDATPLIGGFHKLAIDGAHDMVVAALPCPPAGTYTVVAHSGANATIQTVPPGSTYFGADSAIAVYRKDGSTYTYIGCVGLSEGLTVKAFVDGTGLPVVILYEP